MKRFVHIIAAAAVAIAATPAIASTNGTLGANSTGTVGLTVSVPQRTQISGLTDVAFNNVDISSNAMNSQDICVFSNTKNHQYSLVATGSGTGGAFTLADTTTTTAPVQAYTVAWANTPGQTNGTALTAGGALASQTSSATSPNCSSGGKSASLIIGVPATSLQAMVATDVYTGTLTLLVTPQ